MPDAPFLTPSVETDLPRTSYASWAYAVGGAVAGGIAILAVYAGTGPASGVLMGLAWDRAAGGRSPSLAFQMPTGVSDTQILAGVSGEAVDGRTGLRLADLTQAAIDDRNALSPVAWDRLSAGDCISLTTASGQKLSFRIVGTRNAEPSRSAPGAAPNIDLAITACAPSSDAILKAVIEAKADAKASAVQRSL
jgi:hypothetical protein